MKHEPERWTSELPRQTPTGILRAHSVSVRSETSLRRACNPEPRSSGFPLPPKVCPELAPATPSARGSHSHLGAATPQQHGQCPAHGATLQPEPRPRLTPRKHRILTLFLKQLSDARQVFCGSEVLVTSISWDFLPFVVQHFRANFLRVKEKEKMDLILKPTISMFPDIVEDRDAKSSKH